MAALNMSSMIVDLYRANSTPVEVPTTMSTLEEAMGEYGKYHGPLALVVCIVGVFMNLTIILVLSHKEMLSPVNRLLQAIAVADLLTMASYIPYSLLFYIIHGSTVSADRNNYTAVCYLAFHAAVTNVSHTASIFLTVCIALFRYLYLSLVRGKEICNLRNANIIIGFVAFLSLLVNTPQFLVLRIKLHADKSNESWYHIDNDGMGEHSATINLTQYIIMASLVKIIPSLMLIILSCLLVSIILKNQARYRQITKSSTTSHRREDQANQTTKLLLAVAILFTLAELPQGVLFVMSGVSNEFYLQVFWPIGILLDFITMVSCTINFVLYCSMSAQFRRIFVKMLNLDLVKKPRAASTHNRTRETALDKGDRRDANDKASSEPEQHKLLITDSC